MKLSFLATLLLGSHLALAADPKVEITSFIRTDSESRMAELCGKVTDLTTDTALVRVTVDHKTKRPGYYYTTVESSVGKFCIMVVTYMGSAIVELPKMGNQAASAVVSNNH